MRKALLVTILLVLVLLLSAVPAVATLLGTIAGISASATQVSTGETIDLTITEYNSGTSTLELVHVDLYTGFGTISEVMIAGFYHPSDILYQGYYIGGDDNSNTWLDPGETWVWVFPVQVDADTTFTAIGHGKYSADPPDVTWPDFPLERADVQVTVDGNGDGDGCTPGYWRNHLDMWPDTGYATGDDFDTAFGVDWFDPDITLLQAVNMRGGGLKALTRHAAAALLNAAHPDVVYPMTEGEVIAAVQGVDPTDKAAVTALKNTFDDHNNLGCDIND